jgi:dihydroneopterin aldolase
MLGESHDWRQEVEYHREVRCFLPCAWASLGLYVLGTAMHTSISLRGLQSFGYHGLFDEERTLGQKFLFNVRCDLVPSQTHLGDNLNGSIGYHVLADEIVAISNGTKFFTVEALAETIARTLLEKHAGIACVHSEVAKFSAPMAHTLAGASVEVSLSRQDLQAVDG